MQKQSNLLVLFDSIALPEESGMLTTPEFVQSDRRIAYLHIHDVHEFGLCLKVEGIFIIGDEIHAFRAGDAVSIPAAVPHLAQSAAGTESRWRWSYLDFVRIRLKAFPEQNAVDSHHSGAGLFGSGTPLARRLAEFQASGDPEELAAYAVLLQLAVRNAEGFAPCREREKIDHKVAAALRHFSAHYTGRIDMERLAWHCGMSPATFRRAFRSQLGCSPKTYLTRLRIVAAKAALSRKKMRVEEAAQRCGFATLFCFYRAFLKSTGVSPSEWRNSPVEKTGAVNAITAKFN